jgi:hypothetical protein
LGTCLIARHQGYQALAGIDQIRIAEVYRSRRIWKFAAVRSMTFRPFDQFENQSPAKHFRFQICRMFPPPGGFAHAKSRLRAKSGQFIVGSQRPTDTKIHGGKADIRERVIFHNDRSEQMKEISTMKEVSIIC